MTPSAWADYTGNLHGGRCDWTSQRLHFYQSEFLRSDCNKGALMFEGLFQPMHLLVIVGIALLVFGPKRLPELGKGLGEGIRGFKSAIQGEEQGPVAGEQRARSITESAQTAASNRS
jgi:sec-independent protein translocase protein TatA